MASLIPRHQGKDFRRHLPDWVPDWPWILLPSFHFLAGQALTRVFQSGAATDSWRSFSNHLSRRLPITSKGFSSPKVTWVRPWRIAPINFSCCWKACVFKNMLSFSELLSSQLFPRTFMLLHILSVSHPSHRASLSPGETETSLAIGEPSPMAVRCCTSFCILILSKNIALSDCRSQSRREVPSASQFFAYGSSFENMLCSSYTRVPANV